MTHLKWSRAGSVARRNDAVPGLGRVPTKYGFNVNGGRSTHESWSRAWDKYIVGVQDVVTLSRDSIGRIPHEASEAISKSVF